MEYNIDLKKELLATTSTSFRKLLELGSDAMALYMFYLYTSNYQDNQQVFASVRFIATGLGWTKERVSKNNKILKDSGWIEEIINKDEEGKITGWFVRVNYRVTEGVINTPQNHCLDSQNLVSPDTGYLGQNAPLRNKIQHKEVNAPSESGSFQKFWDLYPHSRRYKKPQCLKKWGSLPLEVQEQIIKDLPQRVLGHDWVKDGGKYIPHAYTYLNGNYWEAKILPAPKVYTPPVKVTKDTYVPGADGF